MQISESKYEGAQNEGICEVSKNNLKGRRKTHIHI